MKLHIYFIITFTFILGGFLVSSHSFAEIQARTLTQIKQGSQDHRLEGLYFQKGSLVRVDQKVVNQDQSLIIDFERKIFKVLFHQEKVYMESAFQPNSLSEWMARGYVSSQLERNIPGKTKKMGTQEIEGHSCQEVVVTLEDPPKQIQWCINEGELLPKRGLILSSKVQDAKGLIHETQLSQISRVQLPDEHFRVPIEYSKYPEPIITIDREPIKGSKS